MSPEVPTNFQLLAEKNGFTVEVRRPGIYANNGRKFYYLIDPSTGNVVEHGPLNDVRQFLRGYDYFAMAMVRKAEEMRPLYMATAEPGEGEAVFVGREDYTQDNIRKQMEKENGKDGS